MSTNINNAHVASLLANYGICGENLRDVFETLPSVAKGVVLYGSRARRDSNEHSDIDVMVIGIGSEAPRSKGRVNTTTYGLDHLEDARGTLFGMHLARDSVVLHDADGQIANALDAMGPVDIQRVFSFVRRMGIALKSSEQERYERVDGMVRLARYLLRTAIYTQAISEGRASFSVRELSSRYNDPTLEVILSSHPDVHGPASIETLSDLEARIETIVGPLDPNPYGDVNSLIVAVWDEDPALANSTLLVLGQPGTNVPYSDLPRIIL
jgi:hypothetical protein